MSTRAMIVLKDEYGNEICNIYHHNDGYLSYLGKTLYSFYTTEHWNTESYYLAAELVQELKNDSTSVYLYPPMNHKTEDDLKNELLKTDWEYIYEIQNGNIKIFATDWSEGNKIADKIYDGPIQTMNELIEIS